MSLLAVFLLIVLVLVAREEILSYTCRRQIADTQKEYLLFLEQEKKREEAYLPMLTKPLEEPALLNSPGSSVKAEKNMREAA